MSICPVPDNTMTFMVSPTPSTSTVNPPAPREESCGVSATTTVISGGSGSTSTTVYVPGPAGPKGDPGTAEFQICMKWEGLWNPGFNYTAGSVENKEHASVVKRNGIAYVCVADHESNGDNFPYGTLEYPQSGLGYSNWIPLSEVAYDPRALSPDSRDWLTKMQDGLFDWVDDVGKWAENATVLDWLGAAAVAGGVIWAGSALIDAMSASGEVTTVGGTTASITYTGSPGYTGAIEGGSLKELLVSLCDFCGVDCDVTLLTDVSVSMPIPNNPKVVDVIAELANVYQFDRVDSGGILKFVPRNILPVRTIALSDIGYSNSATPGAPIVYKREQGINLPRQVTITYVSVAQDYGRFGQTSQLLSFENGNDATISTVITLDDSYAKKLADITLVNANLQRSTVSFTGTLDLIDLEVGDIVDLETFGPVRIMTIDEADNGLLDFVACDAGSPTNIAYSEPTGVITAPPASNNTVVYSGYSDTFWVDLPVMDAEDKSVRMYAAVHGYGKSGWPGATIYKSVDGGASYDALVSSNIESTWGLVAIATPAVDYHVWDDTSMIEVTLKTGTLSTNIDAAVLNGANRAMLGREMIAFGTATLIGPKQYRLTHLLRGLQGTDVFVGEHLANELFVLVDDSLVRIDLTLDERTKPIMYKTVTSGHDISETDAVTVACNSNNLTPWRVSRPLITKASNDYNVTWTERLRYDNGLKDGSDLIHDEDYSGFAVAVLDGTSAVKRRSIVWTNTWTYTADMQVTDFGSMQSSVKISITQLSTKGIAGYPYVINSAM